MMPRVDPALAVWLVWLVVCLLFAAFIPIWWTRKRSVHERPKEQTTLMNAMLDWLQQPRIAQAVIESGAFTTKQLQFTLEALPWMSEYQLKTAAAAILKDRMVRRVIASYMEKELGKDRAVVLQALKDWSEAA